MQVRDSVAQCALDLLSGSYLCAVAPHYIDGLVSNQTFFVNPCDYRCEVCYGFYNDECSHCSQGYYLFVGTTCVEPTQCAAGQVCVCAPCVCVFACLCAHLSLAPLFTVVRAWLDAHV